MNRIYVLFYQRSSASRLPNPMLKKLDGRQSSTAYVLLRKPHLRDPSDIAKTLFLYENIRKINNDMREMRSF